MKRKKALAALLICSYKNRGRNVNTLYLAVLEAQRKMLLSATDPKSTEKTESGENFTSGFQNKILQNLGKENCCACPVP